MTTKLAIKHKDSLALKENRSFHEEKKLNLYEQFKRKRWEYLLFPWVILIFFLIYWFIMCPLIWVMCSRSWPSYWSFLFWIVAFLIWIVIMYGLIMCWRCFEVRQDREVDFVISKYGSDNVERSLNIHQISLENTNSPEIKISSLPNPESKNDSGSFRRTDLSPLVIHRQMSGEKIEDTGVVHVEKDENGQLDIVTDYTEKSPLQDYLKLVTVSPSEDETTKSPKTPMSPREMFFIDLIREAEKAESAKSLKKKTHFFPDDATEISSNDGAKNAKDAGEDVESAKDRKNKETSEGTSKGESNYFIANVESPISEKTEIFLQIDPSADDEQIELIVEKPVLILQSNEANSEEIFIPQDVLITEDNNCDD